MSKISFENHPKWFRYCWRTLEFPISKSFFFYFCVGKIVLHFPKAYFQSFVGLFYVHFLYFPLEISKLFQLDIFRIALECFIFKMSCEIRLWTCFRISHPFQVHINKLFVVFIEISSKIWVREVIRVRKFLEFGHTVGYIFS